MKSVFYTSVDYFLVVKEMRKKIPSVVVLVKMNGRVKYLNIITQVHAEAKAVTSTT